jgi:hypothetical protein
MPGKDEGRCCTCGKAMGHGEGRYLSPKGVECVPCRSHGQGKPLPGRERPATREGPETG